MKKQDIAQMIGIGSRQHIDFVLSGKRNFSYRTAKKATLVIGGNIGLWMEKNRENERKEVWCNFLNKLKKAEDSQ